MEVKLSKGRFFDERDCENAPKVPIVNEAFARKFFLNEDSVGREVTVWFAKTTIIGVVADFKMNSLERRTLPEIFWSLRQAASSNVWLIVRGNPGFSSLEETLREKIQDIDPDLPVSEMQRMSDVIADSLSLKRVSAPLIGSVAVMAILLAVVAIYSMMSYSVRQRRKEMGIRIAFGADRRDLLGLIVVQACRLGIIASVLGCALTLILGRLVVNTVYLSPGEASSLSSESMSPVALVVCSMFLFAVVLVASYAPAMGTLKVDPVVALPDG